MTDTATAAPVSSTTVLEALLAELGAVSLDNAQLSKDPRKCGHYQLLGPVDDHTRRLMILGDQKIVALNLMRKTAEDEAGQITSEYEIQYDAADDDTKGKIIDEAQSKLDALLARFEQEAGPQKRVLSIIQDLLKLEIERQYPAVIGKERVLVNQDCTVGYIDHSKVLEEAIKGFEANGFGLVAEVVGLGHLFGRRAGTGAHAGH